MFKIKLEKGRTMEVEKSTFWHSSAHMLAQAVQRIYPDAKLGIGPSIEQGFYYDFKVEDPFTEEDLIKIEEEMKKISKEGQSIVRDSLTREEAIKFFTDKGEIYKVELIKELPEEEEISIYKQGDFIDLCRGPHIPNTSAVKAIKLLSTSAAYWKGDEENDSLQRIYGISFPKASMLEEYLEFLEEAKKRDHRKLARELELFMFSEEAPGMPLYLPGGMVIKNMLEDYWKKLHALRGYKEIKTPIMMKDTMWHKSGHWDHYKDNMYFTNIDENSYAIKPMSCPGGTLAYSNRLRSYKDLPLRFSELGLVHRHEKSGELNGLLRVRVFTQDDAHIYCLPSQIEEEIIGVLDLVDIIYSKFNLEYTVELSTRPDDFMGEKETWDDAEEALKKALEHNNIEYNINEGDGAFYGPKIDLHIRDSLGRTWQCGTIQLDFQMPERFGLEYIGEDGNKHRPVMIHRAIYGSIERFMAILTEDTAGNFPFWIAPEQVRLLPISDKVSDYANEINKKLLEAGYRSSIDERNEKVGYKIREAQIHKIPYMIIIGEKEEESNMISLRSREDGDLGSITLDEFMNKIAEENK